MYGTPRPPLYEFIDSFSYKRWFQTVYSYILSRVKIKTITTTYTVEADVFYIRVNATGGAITVTLPSALNSAGRQVFVKKIDAGVNAVTVAAAGTDTIEGAASIALAAQWNSQVLISNGNNSWEKI